MGSIDGHTIDCAHASQVYATPASCQKIITALVALKELGSQYRYATQLFVEKKRGKIHNVWIRFSGDPLLSSDQLKQLLEPLKQPVYGTIFMDQGGAFLAATGQQTYCPGWMIEDMGTSYCPPVSFSNIDRNLIALNVQGRIIGTQAVVSHNAPGFWSKMTACVQVANEPTDIRIILGQQDDTVNLVGTLNAKEGLRTYTISPKDLPAYMRAKVRSVVKELGILGSTGIHPPVAWCNLEHPPKNAVCISRVQSPPLKDFLPAALKMSDNKVFDALYLTLLHRDKGRRCGNMGSRRWGEALLKKHFSLDMLGAFFTDGSGVSRRNRIQPRQLFALLKKGVYVPGFVGGLPRPGEEHTTLQNRMNLPDTVRAKTGSLSGVSCLSGYLLPNNPAGKNKAFVMMAQGFSGPETEMHAVIDAFVFHRVHGV
jgi:D-alanyl-D-alanine carboxypeptidase/D-alanyl-D-alanine-endopeptidase (penicillin-binding protein 4)